MEENCKTLITLPPHPTKTAARLSALSMWSSDQESLSFLQLAFCKPVKRRSLFLRHGFCFRIAPRARLSRYHFSFVHRCLRFVFFIIIMTQRVFALSVKWVKRNSRKMSSNSLTLQRKLSWRNVDMKVEFGMKDFAMGQRMTTRCPLDTGLSTDIFISRLCRSHSY